MSCVLCGGLHKTEQHCPCPRCGICHPGTCCHDPCAKCNLYHDGICSGRVGSWCSSCGEAHRSWVNCPCPRCYFHHDRSADCPSVEQWKLFSCNGSYQNLIGSCCLICGLCHDARFACPCPRCHHSHASSMCPDVCSFCSNCHEGECDHVVVPFLLNVCGYCYGANDQCTCLRIFGPCNRCFVWHLASCCERHSFEDRRYLDGSFSSCSICGIWHGSDDCFQKRYLDSLYAMLATPSVHAIDVIFGTGLMCVLNEQL